MCGIYTLWEATEEHRTPYHRKDRFFEGKGKKYKSADKYFMI